MYNEEGEGGGGKWEREGEGKEIEVKRNSVLSLLHRVL